MTEETYYDILKRNCEASEGLIWHIYNLVLEEYEELEHNGENGEKFIFDLTNNDVFFSMDWEYVDDLFLDHLETISQWLAELFRMDLGYDIVATLAEEFDDLLCTKRETRSWLFQELLKDLIQRTVRG